MREMVSRERLEKVAHLRAITRIVGQMYNVDADKAFGAVVSEYASEVFQETYDAELLRKKISVIREAQARVRKRRTEDTRQLDRLERMGEYYDREFGKELRPLSGPEEPLRPINLRGSPPSSR